jgi:uncharacterized membrane protein YbhN (UPF0104 family)
MKSAIIGIAKFAIIAFIFAIIANNIYSNWEQLKGQKIHFDIFYGILSILVMALAWISTSWSWGKTLELFGFKLGYRDVFVIYFRSMVGKYLPGKFWQIIGSTYFASKKGVPEGLTIASVVIGQVYSLLSGFVLFAAAVVLWGIRVSPDSILDFRWSSGPVLLFMLVLSFRPGLMIPIMNWFLRLLKREEIQITIGTSKAIKIFVLFLFPWLIFGLSFWLFACSLTFLPFSQYPLLTSVMVGATVIGFLAIFAPGGVGVREGLIVLLMPAMTEHSVSFASAVALGYRLITTLVELIAFGLTWLIRADHKKLESKLSQG